MRKVSAVLLGIALVLAGFLVRGVMIPSGANAAVAGLDNVGLRNDDDFRHAVEWIVERCDIEPGLGGGYQIDC